MPEQRIPDNWGNVEGMHWPSKSNAKIDADGAPDTGPEMTEPTNANTGDIDRLSDMSPSEAAKWDAKRREIYDEKHSEDLPN